MFFKLLQNGIGGVAGNTPAGGDEHHKQTRAYLDCDVVAYKKAVLSKPKL